MLIDSGPVEHVVIDVKFLQLVSLIQDERVGLVNDKGVTAIGKCSILAHVSRSRKLLANVNYIVDI